ncbi:MAG: hypothetical protein ACRC6I_16875 [Paracoccaceae bacterium]
MADLDDSFDGLPGFAKMHLVARNFDFGRVLPAASFPAGFVKTYETIAGGDPVDWDNNRIYFLAKFAEHSEICMYDGFFSPQSIQSQNAIIAESMYGEAGDLILPPGHYAIGSAYGKEDEMRLLVCLQEDQPHYGAVYAWYLAHDAIGTGDNTRGLAFVANDLHSFFANLQPEDVL